MLGVRVARPVKPAELTIATPMFDAVTLVTTNPRNRG